jgi:serine/threonine protein kinase
MDKATIRQIGRYQLLDVIGQGGMGIVYRAVDASIGRTVAIKMLHGAHAGDKDLLTRFHREVRSTANLQHKNIVTVYALDDFEGFPYMVMEHLEGQSMAEIITSRRPLHLVEKIALLVQVCEGLQYAHERNVIHRDIKPANVLVLKDGTAKIVDFGIARVGMSETLTQTGQVIGSVYYMSPEQIGGAPVDNRSDIYSAGVTLYQFITGELPFKGSETDPHSTLVKILNEPVPSLGKYLSNYPIALDEIIARAMAKKPEARYQTAEDFGYDLSRLQESLKRDMTEVLLSRAKVAIDQKDWEVARQQLREVLKFERRNVEANELLQTVSQEIQRQQRSVQIVQLRSQAQIALAGLQYEEAFECVEQALRLDPNDAELVSLSTSIKDQIERARELTEALRRGQAALYAGDLNEAQMAVRAALNIEQGHTEARALESLIEKELEERARRAQLNGFVEEARREISNRKFLLALESLQKAQAIDPGDSNIRELLNWAARGHEQEKLRSELQRCTNDIGKLLGEERYEEALGVCEASLQRFPGEPSLLKLQQLASHQNDLLLRRRAVDRASAEARRLVESDRSDEAVEVLEQALKSFPNDSNLETLLAITRAETEQRRLEKEERERHEAALEAERSFAEPATGIRGGDLELLKALQEGLDRKLPISQLRLLADRVDAVSKERPLNAQEAARYSSTLAEFNSRRAKRERDYEELGEIERSIRGIKGGADVDLLLDRARSIKELHAKDEEIRGRHTIICQLIGEFKLKREAVVKQISDLLQSMQGNQNLPGLLTTEAQMREVSALWVDDVSIRSLLNQASVHIDEARKYKEQLLQELAQLTESLSIARSAGQIRLLEEQAKMLSTDLDDTDIEKAIRELHSIAQKKLLLIEDVVSQFRELAARVSSAQTFAEVEKCDDSAQKLALQEADSEEANDLLRRIRHSVEERKKEYRRIEATLERLVENSAKATGPAELDLILARRRDVLKKYPDDPHFRTLETRLETSVSERRAYLAETASADELSEIDELLGSDIEDAHAEDNVVRIPTRADPRSTTTPEIELQRRNPLLRIGVPIATLAGAIGAAAFFFFSEKTVLIRTNPAGATITVDAQRCGNPCTIKLRAGKHELLATQAGFEDLHQTVTVPWSGGELPVYTMSALATPVDRGSTVPPLPPELHEGQLSIDAKMPDASVFIDGKIEGRTSANGKVTIATIEGAHELRVEKQGYKGTASKVVNVAANANVLVVFNLEALASSATSAIPPSTTTRTAASEPAKIKNPSSAAAPIVTPAPLPVSVTKFTSNPEKVSEGQTVTLAWQTENANDATLEGVGSVPVSGSRQINLDKSTTFRLTAKGPGGTVTESLHVDVVSPTKAAPPGPTEVDPDRQAIKLALNRYKEAYESESLDDMKQAWPSITKGQLSALKETFNRFNAIRLHLNCKDEDIHIQGDQASINCGQVYTYTMKGKKLPEEDVHTAFLLKKQGASWVVDSVR